MITLAINGRQYNISMDMLANVSLANVSLANASETANVNVDKQDIG